MRRILITLIILLNYYLSYTQTNNATGNITGSVNDINAKPIEAATATLLKSKDSSIIKLTISDKAGNFDFENIPNGKYLVSVSSTGLETSFSKIFELTHENNSVNLKQLSLNPLSKTLEAIIVNNK